MAARPRRGGLIGRLARWLGGGGSSGDRDRVVPEETPAERLDAARQRLKETIEPVEDEDRSPPEH